MHASPIKLLALSASTVSAAVHVVKVGESGLNFSPSNTNAKVGDTVEFHFYQGFHSVAQSSFAKPCAPINSTAFFSGDQNIKSKVSDKVFTIEVKTNDPIWYYCAVQGHCQGGMVGAINAPTSGQRSFEAFAKAASGSDDSTAPQSTGGGTFGAAETGSATGTASGTATATATTSGTAAASATTSGNAGIEARGEIRWGLMSGALAALFGGLMM
ncbi:extracellular serine-rich protein [Fusarium austroafricanum]|uniref:Extracellular serine-rich protein n=1 Tax=Fusarium austroafricanum TaxID=2364996 RepID=A0A8H4P3H2_9HYPO|nr:extracellular serine-rich protein [Fusarium austroafricanum]